MGKSIKLGSDTYLDWSGVTINSSGKTLNTLISPVEETFDKVATANTYVKFGTITIPKNSYACIAIGATYLNSAPLGVGAVSSGGVWGNAYQTVALAEGASYTPLIVTTYGSALSYDIYGKFTASNMNRMYVTGFIMAKA